MYTYTFAHVENKYSLILCNTHSHIFAYTVTSSTTSFAVSLHNQCMFIDNYIGIT